MGGRRACVLTERSQRAGESAPVVSAQLGGVLGGAT